MVSLIVGWEDHRWGSSGAWGTEAAQASELASSIACAATIGGEKGFGEWWQLQLTILMVRESNEKEDIGSLVGRKYVDQEE